MPFIKLTQNRQAIVDNADFDWLSQWKWHWVRPRYDRGSGYAATIFIYKDIRIRVFMHQLLLPWKVAVEPDHCDGNGLNNQRSNLRYATRSEQCCNKAIRIDNSTGFKGVRIGNQRAKVQYAARIQVGSKRYTHGWFATPVEAALAYNFLAQHHYGDYARLNEVHL